MSVFLRILLIVASIITFLYVAKKIRKEQLKLENSIFWIVLSIVLILLGIFPQIVFACAEWLGVVSPVNFIFLFMIFILLYKVFVQSIKIAHLEEKISNLVQEIAVREHDGEKHE